MLSPVPRVTYRSQGLRPSQVVAEPCTARAISLRTQHAQVAEVTTPERKRNDVVDLELDSTMRNAVGSGHTYPFTAM